MRIGTRIALQFAVSLAFLGVLLWRVHIEKLVRDLRGADWRLALAAVPVMALSSLLHGLRWWILVRRAGRVPFRDGILAVLVASGVDLLLPFHAGLAVLFQVLARRYGIHRAAVMGTLGAEGLVDVIVLVLLAVIAAPFLAIVPRLSGAFLVVGGIAVVGAAGFAALGRLPVARHWLSLLVPPRFRVGVRRFLGHLFRSFSVFGSPVVVVVLVVATFVDWTVAAVGHAIVGLAFHLHVALPTYMAVEVAGNLAGAVPLTQGNIGPYELVVRELLAKAGANGDRAAAFAVGTHAVMILAILTTAVIAAAALRLRPSDIWHLEQEAAHEHTQQRASGTDPAANPRDERPTQR